MFKKLNKKGFTLAELLVVVAIIEDAVRSYFRILFTFRDLAVFCEAVRPHYRNC